MTRTPGSAALARPARLAAVGSLGLGAATVVALVWAGSSPAWGGPAATVASLADSLTYSLASAIRLELLGIAALAGLASSADGDGDVATLVEGVERVADGDYDVAFDVDRDDEVGRLADALDDMTEAVAAREPSSGERTAPDETRAPHDETRAAPDETQAAAEEAPADGGSVAHGAGAADADTASVTDPDAQTSSPAAPDDVLDAIDDVFYVLDREGDHRTWNRTLEDVTGRDHETVAEMHPLDHFEGDDEETIEAAIEAVFETGHARARADLQTSDGDAIPYEWIASRLEAPDGTPVVAGVGRDVTERVETEHRLREREQRLEQYAEYTDAILDTVTDVFYVVGSDRSFQRWNRALCVATGYDDAEIAEMDPTEFVVEDDHDVITAAIAEAFETGSARAEARVRTKDGEVIPYEFVGSALEDPDGEPVLVGVGRDVADRKERQRRLEALVENTTNPIYIKDCEGRYRFINETGASYFDATPAEVLGSRDEDLFDAEGAAAAREADERVVATGQTITDEVVRHIDGEEHVFIDDKYPYRDENGEIVGIMGISRDITGRKRREREVHSTNARLEAVIEASPDALVAVDREGTVELWNPAAERIFGWSAAEVVGEQVPFVPDESAEEYRSFREAILDGETLAGVETTREREDGSSVDVSLSAAPLRDSAGEIVGVMAAIEDITERKAYQHELERTQFVLEQAQQLASVGAWELSVPAADATDLRWTEEIYRIHELSPDETVDAARALEFYHPDDRDRVREAVDRAIREARAYDIEARIVTGEGTERWIRTIGEPVVEDDRVVRIRGSVQDVTQRHERERELGRTRDLLEQAQRIAGVGGWELDVRSDPYAFEGTDEFYRIHGLSPKSAFDYRMAVEFFHPADRDRMRAAMAAAIESGTPYDEEARLSTAADRQRWIRVIAEPVEADGEVVALRGSIQDVTDRKEHELTLESLHDVARGLLEAESRSAVGDLIVDSAVEVLDLPHVGVYLLDDGSGRLEPAAVSERLADAFDGSPPSAAPGEPTPLWDAYVSGDARTLDEAALAECELAPPESAAGVAVPIGDHGVFVATSARGSVASGDRRVAEMLVATMEAALDRLDTEAELRTHEADLEAQNRRLRRQIQINEIIRRVDQSLVGAGTREAIETAVCERLVESEDVAFAWIGAPAPDGPVVPRAWAGRGEAYLDEISLATDGDLPDPAVRTAATGEPTVVESIVEDVKTEPWRKHALVRDFSSAVTVPLGLDEFSYGVLAVYGTEPGAFGDLERTVFEELGESIANSINAVEARHALYADAFVELRLRLDPTADFLGTVAAETDARVEYVGLATHAADESRLFFETDGAGAATVEDALEDRYAVHDHRLISDEGDDQLLYEATVAGDVLAARLVQRGGVPRSMSVEDGRFEVVVDVPTTTDVREFVEMVREVHPSAELVGRRNVHRDVQTRQELVSDLFEELTERQVEVLRTAFFAGFFEWPRESTGEDVADMLDVSQPTINRHVRHGLARLLEQLFEEEPPALAEA